MSTLRKLFVSALSVMVVMTVVGGFTPAKAATDGSLIKHAGDSALYLLSGGKRYVFPTSSVYFSWYKDFSSVQTVSLSELQSYPLAKNAVVRPGTKLVKVTTDPKVYVVGKTGVLHWVKSEDIARTMYGSNWASMVVDLPDAFFVSNYSIGSEIASAGYVDGQLVTYAGDPTIYMVENSAKRPVTSDGFTANNFNQAYVVTAPSSISYSNGSSVTSKLADYSLEVSAGGSSGSGSTSTEGAVTISLDSTSPASAVVPSGASNVPFLNIRLATGAQSTKINSIVLHRIGAGATTDFNNVYLYDGNLRLTLGRTINSSSNTATFSGLNLSIAANSTKVITVSADMASTGISGNVDSLEVVAASDVVGPVSVAGTFPVRGNMMSYSSAAAGTVTVTKSGSYTSAKIGDLDRAISAFQLGAGSAEDITVKRITLYQAGSIEKTQLMNLKLKQGGTVVASATGIDANNLVNFVFSTPFTLAKGDTRIFEVYADIGLQARVSTTINLYLDQSTDLYAVGNTYGFGVSVTNSTYTSSGVATSHLITLSGAQITTTFTGPTSADLAKNQTDVVLWTGKMAAQANIEVRQVSVTLDGDASTVDLVDGSGSANFTNVKISNADTGALLFGPTDLSGIGINSSQTITLSGPYSFVAGQVANLKITANIANTITADATIKATLSALSATYVRNLDTGLNLTASDIVPATSLVGNQHTVRAAALTVSLSGNPTSQSYTRGSLAKNFLGINLRAGSGADATMTSLKLHGYIGGVGIALCANGSSADYDSGGTDTNVDCTSADDAGTATAVALYERIASMQLFDSGTGLAIGDVESVNSNGTVMFDNLLFNIPSGSTKTLLARADISNTAINNNIGTFYSYRLAFDLLAGSGTTGSGTNYSTNVVARDTQGNTASVSGPTASVNAETSPTVAVTVVGSGSLTASAAPTDTESQAAVKVAGSTGVVMAKYRFFASNEDIKVTKLKFTAAPAANYLGLWLVDGSDVYGQGGKGATQPLTIDSSGVAQFDGLTITVPKDSYKTITVKADLKYVSGGAVSGGTGFAVTLNAGTSTTAEAIGVGSGTRLTGTSVVASDTAGATHKLYKSAPTIQTTTNGIGSTIITGANAPIYRFTVTADAKGDVTVKKVSFNVSASDVAVTTAAADYSLVDVSSSPTTQSATADITAPVATTGGTLIISLAAAREIEVAAGSMKVFEVRANVSGSLTGAALSTSIINTTATSAANAASGSVTGDFIFSDQSDTTGHTTSSADYNNGFLVKNLPTDTFTRQGL
ncbi:MAG: hypothetical protein V1707_00540 [bacterium]